MGKGKIISSLGAGKYSVSIVFNRALAESRIAKMQYDIAVLDSETVPELSAAFIDANNDLSDALATLNEAIFVGDQADILTAQGAFNAKESAYSLAASNLRAAVAKQTSMERRVATLQNSLPEDETVTAWCADLTEGLSGTVATIEVPGERTHVLIRPGHDGRADWGGADDGQLTPLLSTTPAATFYNLAMMPGWQKWKPTYRLGIISNINTDNDTCNVSIDDAISTATGADVNQTTSLSNVPIEYMSCNALAFTDGDHVVVEFVGQDWGDPLVIGFVDNPQPCDGFDVYACPAFSEIKITASASWDDRDWYLTTNDDKRVAGFFDADGTIADGPCVNYHTHIYRTTMMRDGQTDKYAIPSLGAGELFEISGYTLLEQAWVFCATYPNHPLTSDGGPRSHGPFTKIAYEDWQEKITIANTYVNETFPYKSEQSDTWAIMTDPKEGGDCEDYALTKMQKLHDAGLPDDSMDLVYCKLGSAEHAVVCIYTDKGIVYLEQGENNPLFFYSEITDVEFFSRFIDGMSVVAVEDELTGMVNGSIVAGVIKIDKTPARFAYRRGDGEDCSYFVFDTQYVACVQSFASTLHTLTYSDENGDGVDDTSHLEGTATITFYFAVYKLNDSNTFELVASELIGTHETDLVVDDANHTISFTEESMDGLGGFVGTFNCQDDDESRARSSFGGNLSADIASIDGIPAEAFVINQSGWRHLDRYESGLPAGKKWVLSWLQGNNIQTKFTGVEYVFDKAFYSLDEPENPDTVFRAFSTYGTVTT